MGTYPWEQTFGPCIEFWLFFNTSLSLSGLLYDWFYWSSFISRSFFLKHRWEHKWANPFTMHLFTVHPLSSCSRLLMSRVVAVVSTGFVEGSVVHSSILSGATGSSHHKCLYHHPDSSLSPPAQRKLLHFHLQQGNSQKELPATITPSLFDTKCAGQVSSLLAAWRVLCFVKDPTHSRQTSQSSYLLSHCLPASTQLGKHSKAELSCSSQPAQQCRSLCRGTAEAQTQKFHFQNTFLLPGWFAQSSLCPLTLFLR